MTNFYKGKDHTMTKDCILVTGSNGFLGQAFVKSLDLDPLQPYVALGRRGIIQTSQHFAGFNSRPEATTMGLLSLVMKELQPKIVINFAASRKASGVAAAHGIDENEAYLRALLLSMNLELEEARLIQLGSADEYGLAPRPYQEGSSECPVTEYGKSKLRCTNWLRQESQDNSFEFVVLRPSSVYGPNQESDMFIPSVIGALSSHKRMALTSGEQHRDFLYVDDLIAGIIATSVSVMPSNFEVINLAHGKTYSLQEALGVIRGVAGKSGSLDLFTFDKPHRQNEIFDFRLSTQKAQVLLDWQAEIDLPLGLELMFPR